MFQYSQYSAKVIAEEKQLNLMELGMKRVQTYFTIENKAIRVLNETILVSYVLKVYAALKVQWITAFLLSNIAPFDISFALNVEQN